MRMTYLLYSNVPFCTVPYCTVLYCTVLYCTILYTVTSLADTHLLIKPCMLGPLDKSLMHCNYSFKLQGSRGDLESFSLVELYIRPRAWQQSIRLKSRKKTRKQIGMMANANGHDGLWVHIRMKNWVSEFRYFGRRYGLPPD